MMVPTVLARVICDAAWRDPATRTMTLLGTFAEINPAGLPAEIDQICIYYHLSGHRGRVTLRADLYRTADGDEADPLASAQVEAVSPDRLTSVDGSLTLYNVDLPLPGEYHVMRSADDVPFANRRLIVRSAGGLESS